VGIQVEALLKELEANMPIAELKANFAPADAGDVSTLPNVAQHKDALSYTPEELEVHTPTSLVVFTCGMFRFSRRM
jgi:hypothetical protein